MDLGRVGGGGNPSNTAVSKRGSHPLISKDKIVPATFQSVMDGILSLVSSAQVDRRSLTLLPSVVPRGKLQERGQTLHMSRVIPGLA